ncbi:MAG TPA: Maf family protein [Jatrophihabitantaceae bacterium]|jgi:septum formation protein
MRFVLASASPARLATLRRAGVTPEVIVSGVDESAITAPDTATLVGRLAEAKAAAVAGQLDGDPLVLGCDSMLDLDGTAVGKPGSAEDAIARWKAMRGCSGVLYTGHALRLGERALVEVAATEVRFADLDDDEIAAYVATGEPLAVAGAFTVDSLGGWFVESISGDHHNVVGLSLPLLRHMLGRLGLSLADLGWAAGPT